MRKRSFSQWNEIHVFSQGLWNKDKADAEAVMFCISLILIYTIHHRLVPGPPVIPGIKVTGLVEPELEPGEVELPDGEDGVVEGT